MASIFLIGPMGSGKSTVGKALARRIGYPFLDADREIEIRCGVDIPTIFEFEGEAGFRAREKKIITELAEMDPVIMATGGGAILNRSNRKTLRDNGYVIMLSVEIEEQLRRVSLNKNRPLLQGDDVEKKLRVLMDERRALYESTAHHIVSTNSSRMQNVVAKIARHLVRENIIAELAPASSNKKAKNDQQNTKKRTKSQNVKPHKNKTSKSTSDKIANRNKSPVTAKTQKSTPSTKDVTTEAQGKAATSNRNSAKSGKKRTPQSQAQPQSQRGKAESNNRKQSESKASKRTVASSAIRQTAESGKRGSGKGTSK